MYLLFCYVQPYPSRLHNVMEKIVSEDNPYSVQGDVLSGNAEATYRVWLARILEMGGGTSENQWWVALDSFIPKVYKKVVDERKDEAYVKRLNGAVVHLLAHYGAGEAEAKEDDEDIVDMDE